MQCVADGPEPMFVSGAAGFGLRHYAALGPQQQAGVGREGRVGVADDVHFLQAHALAGAQHRRQLRFRLGKGDEQGHLSVGGETIALIRHGVFRLPEEGM